MPLPNIELLDQGFGVSGKVKFSLGKGNLPKICIFTKKSSAEIYLHGAHLTSFKTLGRELIWLSPNAEFQNDKAIRGGVPICWPWFGKHPQNSTLPQHGFARLSNFEVSQAFEDELENIVIVLSLESGNKPLSMFPYQFRLEIKFVIGENLEVSLTTMNQGNESFRITEAIHTYFQVTDIRQTAVNGLDKVSYFDQLEQTSYTHAGNLFFIEETDNIFSSPEQPLQILEAGENIASINQHGANSTIIWNPWIDKSRQMRDFPNQGYLNMLCIEAANTDEGVLIQPGKQHTITQIID